MALKKCLSCKRDMLADENHCLNCGRLQNNEITIVIRKEDSVKIVSWNFTDESGLKHTGVGAIEVNMMIYHFGSVIWEKTQNAY